MTGVPHANFTGMCWDGTVLYGISTSLTASQIFAINTATGVCTPIGAASSICAGGVALMGRIGAQNGLYVIDIVADNFYQVSKSTGVFTLVGSLGVNANFGQDACVDPNDNIFYWIAYTTGPQLRRLDLSGSSTLLCTYPAQGTGIACVPHSSPSANICRNGINIAVPNGSSGARDTIRMIGNNACSLIDINVKIDTFIHTWISDMQFSLTHNGTTNVNLFLNRGGSGDNIIGCTFNDSAANPISSGIAPFTGSFRAEQPLIIYNGQTPSGNWVLFMLDPGGGDLGFLKAWCIEFQFTCPTGGVQTVEIPFTYRLYQNYPNPFNPVTSIKYGLPKYGKTSLVVYDVLGKVVTTLVDSEFKDAGTYEVRWDATNFSSGIYFYRLISGDFDGTMKMVLVK